MHRKGLGIILGVVLLLALTTTVAWAAPLQQDGGEMTTDTLWVTLAPLIAIATSIERVLEGFWDRYERKDAWPNKGGVANTDSSVYRTFKRERTHLLGFGLSLIAIALTNVRLFHLLGCDVLFCDPRLQLFDLDVGGIFDSFTVGTLIDWLATGFVIGWGGTELTHSLIEGLVKGRNLWKEMQAVREGERALNETRLFNETIVPISEQLGIPATTLRQVFETLDTAGVSVDQFIAEMATGKVEQLLATLEAKPQTQEAAGAVRALLEGTPAARPARPVQIGRVLDKLSPELRQRLYGA